VDSFGYDNINFWRTTSGNEVDFILQISGKQQQAIEVNTEDFFRRIIEKKVVSL
jgi:hypothetical protein